ncbi:MAG: hypothetical protein LiPW15_636 [Parcubacteria group bacterium LiPW_15]|nr:MAG: hypothetical protein LiPW15_636 [Parcubacteria group bacterium LiPW_15]
MDAKNQNVETPSEPTAEQIEAYKKEKRAELEATFNEIIKSPAPLFFRGSWAGELLSGTPSEHGDIDLYFDEKNQDEFIEFLDNNGFHAEQTADGKFSVNKGRALFDCHKWKTEGDYYVQEAPYGTFYFPKEGFVTIERNGNQVNIMSPELMWIMKKGGPALDASRKSNLDKLSEFIDPAKLQTISSKFKYIPPAKT